MLEDQYSNINVRNNDSNDAKTTKEAEARSKQLLDWPGKQTAKQIGGKKENKM